MGSKLDELYSIDRVAVRFAHFEKKICGRVSLIIGSSVSVNSVFGEWNGFFRAGNSAWQTVCNLPGV